jgi:hypothetical protein
MPHLVGSHIIRSWPQIRLRKLVHEGCSRGVMCCPAIETGLAGLPYKVFHLLKCLFNKRKREVGGNNLVWPGPESEQTGQAGTGLAGQGQNQALVSILLHMGSAGANRWYLLPPRTGWAGRSTGISSLAWGTWSGGVWHKLSLMVGWAGPGRLGQHFNSNPRGFIN